MKQNNTRKYFMAVIFLVMGIVIILFLFPRFNFLYHKYILNQDCAFRAVTDGGISYIKDDSGRKIGYFICDNDPYFNSFVMQGDPYHPTGIWYAYRPTASQDIFNFFFIGLLFFIAVALIILSLRIFVRPSTLKFI